MADKGPHPFALAAVSLGVAAALCAITGWTGYRATRRLMSRAGPPLVPARPRAQTRRDAAKALVSAGAVTAPAAPVSPKLLAAARAADLEPVRSYRELAPLPEPAPAPAKPKAPASDCKGCAQARDSDGADGSVSFPDDATFRRAVAMNESGKYVRFKGLGACGGGYAYELSNPSREELPEMTVATDAGDVWTVQKLAPGAKVVLRSRAAKLRFAAYIGRADVDMAKAVPLLR